MKEIASDPTLKEFYQDPATMKQAREENSLILLLFWHFCTVQSTAQSGHTHSSTC